MEKEREKGIIAETEKQLSDLISQNKLTLEELEKLKKLSQKLNSNTDKKKKDDNQKNLNDFVSTKPELKDILEKIENNTVILEKSSQKVLSKNQVPKNKSTQKNEAQEKKSKNSLPFKIETINFNEFIKKNPKIEPDSLYIFFENLNDGCVVGNMIPIFTLIFKEGENLNFYFANKDKYNLEFSQLKYLTDENAQSLFEIDYFNMIEDEKEPEVDWIQINKVENLLKEKEFCKNKKVEIKYLENSFDGFKSEVKKSYEEKFKKIKTNNYDLVYKIFE